MMKNRLFLMSVIVLTSFSLFACGAFQTTGAGENVSDMEAIPVVASYEPFLEHYEKIVDVQANIFITNMGRHYPVYVRQDDDADGEAYLVDLNACITDKLTGYQDVGILDISGSATRFSYSSVSLLANGDVINYIRFTGLDYYFGESIGYDTHYYFLSRAMALHEDETVTDVALGDEAITALTSEHRVLTFGRNDRGQLLDGLRQVSPNAVTDRFLDITGNFPLQGDEKIIALDHYYFLTSENRIFIRDEDETTMQTITLYSDHIPLLEDETVTDVYMTSSLRGVFTSRGRFLIENPQPSSITFESETLASWADPGFYDILAYLPLGDDESIVKIKTHADGLMFYTDRPRILRLAHDPDGDMSSDLIVTRFDEGIIYHEGEIPVGVFKTDIDYTYHRPEATPKEFVLTSEGRVFLRND